MNRKFFVLSILPAFALLGTVYDSQTPTTASTSRVVALSSQAGLILNIDPTTGAIVEKPVVGATKLAVPTELASHMTTSDEGLIERPNPSGGKGVYVNLEGRYQNAMVGSVANGKLSTPCTQGPNTAANTAASHK
jgi:hypothetical protein